MEDLQRRFMGTSTIWMWPYAPKISRRWSSVTFLLIFSTMIYQARGEVSIMPSLQQRTTRRRTDKKGARGHTFVGRRTRGPSGVLLRLRFGRRPGL